MHLTTHKCKVRVPRCWTLRHVLGVGGKVGGRQAQWPLRTLGDSRTEEGVGVCEETHVRVRVRGCLPLVRGEGKQVG